MTPDSDAADSHPVFSPDGESIAYSVADPDSGGIHVYVQAANSLVKLDKRTGEFAARTRPAGEAFIAAPLAVGRFLYAFCSDGTLTAYTFR